MISNQIHLCSELHTIRVEQNQNHDAIDSPAKLPTSILPTKPPDCYNQQLSSAA